MAKLDAFFPELAERLIARFGAAASLQTVTKTANLESGQVTETVVAAPVRITPPEPFSIGVIDGSLVEAGDLTTLVAGRGLIEPPVANRDRLELSGEIWQIVSASPIRSGDAVAAYRLQLRR